MGRGSGKKSVLPLKAIVPSEAFETPELTPFPEYGLVMTLEDFLEDVRNHSFVDGDGSGSYATSAGRSKMTVYPSDITSGKMPPAWATHVVWFNK